MKILHIHECSAVAGILAKYQRKLGHDVKHIMGRNSDKLRYSDVYNDNLFLDDELYIHDVIRLGAKCDVLHIHGGVVSMVPVIKKLLPDKKIVAHIYGFNDVKKYVEEGVDLALCMKGLEVLHPSFIGLHLPVDTERLTWQHHDGDKALYFGNKYNTYEGTKPWNDLTKEAEAYSKFNGLDLTVIDRQKNSIPYKDMAEFIRSYDILLDQRGEWNNKYGIEFGSLALESLFSGLSVYSLESHKLYTEFPVEHEASNVVKILDKLYGEMF